MATILTDGFEGGFLPNGWTGSGTIDTTQFHSGLQSCKCTWADFGSGAEGCGFTTTTNLYCNMWFKISVIDGDMGIAPVFVDGAADTMGVWMDSTGHIKIIQNSVQRVITTGVVTAGVWTLLQFHIRESTTNAYHELKMNGETVTNTTNDSVTADFSGWDIGHNSGGIVSNTQWFDDITLDDAAYPLISTSTLNRLLNLTNANISNMRIG